MQALIINQRNTLPIEELNFDVGVFCKQSRLAGVQLPLVVLDIRRMQVMPYWDTTVSVSDVTPDCLWYCFRRRIELQTDELLAMSDVDKLAEHQFDDDALTFLYNDLLSLLSRATYAIPLVESVVARGDWYYIRCPMSAASIQSVLTALQGNS